MAKNTNHKTDGTETTNGMMPSLTIDMETISRILKITGGIGAALGIPSTFALPAFMLFVLILPTLLAPLSPILNTALIAYIVYKVLRKTGHMPELFAKKPSRNTAPQR